MMYSSTSRIDIANTILWASSLTNLPPRIRLELPPRGASQKKQIKTFLRYQVSA